MPLSTDRSERYARQIGLQGWGAEGQERLLASRVFVAGVGGLGCPAAVYLAVAGVGELVVCDGDTVERSNLNRQFLYTMDDLTKPKAAIAAAALRRLNPDVRVTPVFAEIDRSTARGLIEGADLVLDCLDNPETRIALNRATIAARIPMVYAAVAEYTGYLSFLSPPATPCLECFVDGTRPAVDPPVPGCTSGMLGALESVEALKFLTGTGQTLAGKLLVVEGAVPSFDVIDIVRDPDCPACGRLD
ncbi:MAG: HesA/MoeB/ThiF family protein [Candidatus Eisenbacteria bacterium]